MLIRIHTVQPSILLPVPVLLEVNISRGIKFHISGNVHSSIKENRQRIYATLKNEGWHWRGNNNAKLSTVRTSQERESL